jgi:hypothetical protein
LGAGLAGPSEDGGLEEFRCLHREWPLLGVLSASPGVWVRMRLMVLAKTFRDSLATYGIVRSRFLDFDELKPLTSRIKNWKKAGN